MQPAFNKSHVMEDGGSLSSSATTVEEFLTRRRNQLLDLASLYRSEYSRLRHTMRLRYQAYERHRTVMLRQAVVRAQQQQQQSDRYSRTGGTALFGESSALDAMAQSHLAVKIMAPRVGGSFSAAGGVMGAGQLGGGPLGARSLLGLQGGPAASNARLPGGIGPAVIGGYESLTSPVAASLALTGVANTAVSIAPEEASVLGIPRRALARIHAELKDRPAGDRLFGGPTLPCGRPKCPNPAVPLSPFCIFHLCADSGQKLFVPCAFKACRNMVLRNNPNAYCEAHIYPWRKSRKGQEADDLAAMSGREPSLMLRIPTSGRGSRRSHREDGRLLQGPQTDGQGLTGRRGRGRGRKRESHFLGSAVDIVADRRRGRRKARVDHRSLGRDQPASVADGASAGGGSEGLATAETGAGGGQGEAASFIATAAGTGLSPA